MLRINLERLQGSRIGQKSEWAELNCDAFTTKASADLTGSLGKGGSSKLFHLETIGPGLYTSAPTSHWMWAAPGKRRKCDFGGGGCLQLGAIPGERQLRAGSTNTSSGEREGLDPEREPLAAVPQQPLRLLFSLSPKS